MRTKLCCLRRSARLSIALACCVLPKVARTQAPNRPRLSHLRKAVASRHLSPVAALPSDHHLNLSVMLPLRNEDQLKALLVRLYDPASPDFHHFLTVSEFADRFGPTAADHKAVADYARAHGFHVADTPANRMAVSIDGSASQVEKAFHVAMKVYQHPTENRTFFSPDREPSLDLAVPVWHIAGLDNFSTPHPAVSKAQAAHALARAVGTGPGGSYMGSDMRTAYYGGSTLTGAGQVVGLWESYSYNINDVNLTFSTAGQTYSVPVNDVLLDGMTAGDGTDDVEPVLDIVQAISMAPGLSQVRVYLGNNQVDIFNAMATENIAKQISVSYIWEPDNYQTLDPIFEEFQAQGQTVFAASGDDGAYQPSVPSYYPSEDTYVTSTGGTSISTAAAGGAWTGEVAWMNSGGGVGWAPYDIGIPSWQQGIANASNGGSTTLRNVPDVSMDSDWHNYACEDGYCSGGWGGTSFAAPRWAGFMALINQQAESLGYPPLGFINTSIYSLAQSSIYSNLFHDITSGNNGCCGQSTWYNAVTGYDLVTGWGSPTGPALINQLAGGFSLSATPSTINIPQGATGYITVNVAEINGFSGNISLATSGLPTQTTAAFSPNPATYTSTLTIATTTSTPIQSATVTINGNAGVVTAGTSLNVNIVAAPAAQTIAFFQPPAPATIGAHYTLTASSSAGPAYPVSFSVSGPATLSGSTITFTGTGTVMITASQPGDSFYSAATPVVRSVPVQNVPTVTWNPAPLEVFTGVPLGTGFLDATGSVPGAFTYTATNLSTGNPAIIDTSSKLAAGSYYLSAVLYPTDSTNYSTAAANLTITVQNQSIFVVNGPGSISSLFDNGVLQANEVPGGGVGAAVDGLGHLWSANIAGASLSSFADAGSFVASFPNSTVSQPAAVAIDGANTAWVVNSTGSLSGTSSSGLPISSVPLGMAAGLSSPASLSVDAAGSLWIANPGNNTVTEIIGAAAPTVAPTITAVTNATMGSKP